MRLVHSYPAEASLLSHALTIIRVAVLVLPLEYLSRELDSLSRRSANEPGQNVYRYTSGHASLTNFRARAQDAAIDRLLFSELVNANHADGPLEWEGNDGPARIVSLGWRVARAVDDGLERVVCCGEVVVSGWKRRSIERRRARRGGLRIRWGAATGSRCSRWIEGGCWSVELPRSSC